MAPVHTASMWNDVETLRRLLDEEPELLEAEDDAPVGYRPLHFASHWGSMEAACLLLDRGAEVNCRGRGGDTPLMRACELGHAETVAMLLDRGADPTMASPSSGRTALICASCGGARHGTDHAAVIRLLFKDGRVPIDAYDKEGRTALWSACFFGYTDRACVLLLEGRADHTMDDFYGVTPMAATGREGLHDCIQLLKWYEGQLEVALPLSKARAVVDATESISKAPEKVGAKTEAEAQQAREAAAPAYLRDRVKRHEALPCGDVGRGDREGMEEDDEDVEEEEDEPGAVLKFVVTMLKDDLLVELMEGLRLR